MSERSIKKSRYGLVVSTAMLTVCVAQTTAPSPLYSDYQVRFGLSAVILATIFAVYVIGLIATLLTAGALSDHVGRKPVVVAGGVISLLALALLAFADNVAMLMIARVLQGVCIGLVGSALGAALLDFQLPRRLSVSIVLNGIVPPLAMAAGAIASAVLAVVLPNPEFSVYAAFGAATIVSIVLWLFVEERAPKRLGAWKSLRPTISLPPPTRPVFFAVIWAICATWALGGLYASSAATISHSVLHLTGPLASGLAIVALQVPAGIVGVVTSRIEARKVLVVGLSTIIIGSALTAWALAQASVWGFFVATIVTGMGFGGGLQPALRLVIAETPVTQRAGVLSSVYIVSYLALGLPSVVAGFATPFIGYTLTISCYLVVVGLLSAGALTLQLRSRNVGVVETVAEQDEADERVKGDSMVNRYE